MVIRVAGKHLDAFQEDTASAAVDGDDVEAVVDPIGAWLIVLEQVAAEFSREEFQVALVGVVPDGSRVAAAQG